MASRHRTSSALKWGDEWFYDEDQNEYYQEAKGKKGETYRRWQSEVDFEETEANQQAAGDPRSFHLGDLAESLPETSRPGGNYTVAAAGGSTQDFGSSLPDASSSMGDEIFTPSASSQEYGTSPLSTSTAAGKARAASFSGYSGEAPFEKAVSSPPEPSRSKGKGRAGDSRPQMSSTSSSSKVSSSKDKSISSKARLPSAKEQRSSKDKASSSSRKDGSSSKHRTYRRGDDDYEDSQANPDYAQNSTPQQPSWPEAVPEEAGTFHDHTQGSGSQGYNTGFYVQPAGRGEDDWAAASGFEADTDAAGLPGPYGRGKSREIPSREARQSKRSGAGSRRQEHPRSSQPSRTDAEDPSPLPEDDSADPELAAAFKLSSEDYSGYDRGQSSRRQDYEPLPQGHANMAALDHQDASNEYDDENEDEGQRTPTAATTAPIQVSSYVDEEIKGTMGAVLGMTEPADPRYKVEPSSKFKRGMVFKMLWPEPMGSHTKSENPQPSVTERELDGAKFYISFRRFVIVRNDEGFCNCVPILTYGKQGCRKGGSKPRMHGIIFQSGKPAPKTLPGEHKLGFAPLPMHLTVKSEKIAPESRVNYAKLVSIEHNVKVFFVGQVPKEKLQMIQDAVDKCWNEKKAD